MACGRDKRLVHSSNIDNFSYTSSRLYRAMEQIQSVIHSVEGHIMSLMELLDNVDHVNLAFADTASDTLFSSAQDLITVARNLLAMACQSSQMPHVPLVIGASTSTELTPSPRLVPCFSPIPLPYPRLAPHFAPIRKAYTREPFINAIVCALMTILRVCLTIYCKTTSAPQCSA